MDLWRILASFIESGIEGPKVDLKRQFGLETRAERAKFAKDVLALANTGGGQGYLVIGVLDAKERSSRDPEDYIVGFEPQNLDALDQLIQQSLDTYCDPVPKHVRYETLLHPTAKRPMGVVVIPRSYERPHLARQNGEGLVAGQVYLRRGANTFAASDKEVNDLLASRGATRVLINFGRGISEAQMRQLETLLNSPIYETINIPSALEDSRDYESQVLERIQQAGLTREEWESLDLLLNVHPFAPATALFLGVVHGLKGCFPDVIRMRRIGDTNEFEVAEILHPQVLRDRAARGRIP